MVVYPLCHAGHDWVNDPLSREDGDGESPSAMTISLVRIVFPKIQKYYVKSISRYVECLEHSQGQTA